MAEGIIQYYSQSDNAQTSLDVAETNCDSN